MRLRVFSKRKKVNILFDYLQGSTGTAAAEESTLYGVFFCVRGQI